MFNLKPKEDKFFELFGISARIVRDGAAALRDVMNDCSKLDEKTKLISDLEHEADDLNDAIIDRLNQTFITPLDREDIYSIANMLDDVMDAIQGTVERIVLYDAGEPTAGAVELARILHDCTEKLVKSFDLLKNIKGNHQVILDSIRKIAELESEADRIYRAEVANLFKNCKDPIEIFKWKEITEHIEDATDHCEHIGDLLRGVILKYA